MVERDTKDRNETENFLNYLSAEEHLDGDGLGELLREHRIDKLKLIAENTIDVICLHHPADGRYLYASPSTEKIMGYSAVDLEGKVPYDFIYPGHLAGLQENIRNTIVGGNSSIEKLELLFKTKNNGYQWFEGYTKPVHNKQGTVVLVLSCTRNIQDRKLAEIEKKKREAIQQNLLLTSALFEKKKAIIQKIEQKILQLKPDMRKELRSVLTHIQESLNLDESWEDFMIHFKQIHPDFYKNISTAYPELSARDLKHLGLIKLGMTSTDIAKALLVKKQSLRVSRNRLKHKLGLSATQELSDFVNSF